VDDSVHRSIVIRRTSHWKATLREPANRVLG